MDKHYEMENPANNSAAWFTRAATPFQIKAAPMPTPRSGEIVVRTGAVAANPIDWIIQHLPFIAAHIKMPYVIGSDVAGEVIQVASDVSKFKVGQRVLGLATSTDKRTNHSAYGAFQNYVVLQANVASIIPDNMTFEEACVLPLGLSTAACALYMTDFLALRRPSMEVKCTGQSVIIWGASTSVGMNAVQLAHISGYDVIATASPKNFNLIRSLGAKNVFDYRSNMVVRDIIGYLEGRRCAGAVAIGDGSTESCIDILAATKGSKFVAQVSVPLTSGDITTFRGKVSGLLSVLTFKLRILLKKKLKRINSKFVFGSDLIANDVGTAIFNDFLPVALAESKYIAAPAPMVIGIGLERVQEALDINRKGVSARKVVVTLSES